MFINTPLEGEGIVPSPRGEGEGGVKPLIKPLLPGISGKREGGVRPRLALVLFFSSLFLVDFVADDLLFPVRASVARAASGVLNLFGIAATSEGALIVSPELSVEIVNECTGIEALILLVSAILVFPASWRAKGIGVLLSLGVMAVVNFLRVVSLCYLGTYSATLLEAGHIYVWPVGVIITGLATLLFWVERIVIPHG